MLQDVRTKRWQGLIQERDRAPQNDRDERVPVPTEGDSAGLESRRAASARIPFTLQSASSRLPMGRPPTFACSIETVVGEEAVVSTMSGAPRARPGRRRLP
jgi:hypothetical protein